MRDIRQRDKAELIRTIEAEIYRTAGRYYRIELETLDIGSLREMHRMLLDLDAMRMQLKAYVHRQGRGPIVLPRRPT